MTAILTFSSARVQCVPAIFHTLEEMNLNELKNTIIMANIRGVNDVNAKPLCV